MIEIYGPSTPPNTSDSGFPGLPPESLRLDLGFRVQEPWFTWCLGFRMSLWKFRFMIQVCFSQGSEFRI